VYLVANDDDAVEGQTRFGAVPGNELIDGILVDAARAGEVRLLSADSLE
jgi:hypothetical protein